MASVSTIDRRHEKTRRDETEDWMLGEDLKSDEKEVAEHMMLVDPAATISGASRITVR